MIKRNVYLDLDGVMADFESYFETAFGYLHNSVSDDVMWKTINSHPKFFRNLPPCNGAIEFFKSIEHLDPIILTACPKTNYNAAALQKKEWVREHLSDTCWVLPVLGGRNKALFMHNIGDILIDDYESNIKALQDEKSDLKNRRTSH